jgi:hypothetical protein
VEKRWWWYKVKKAGLLDLVLPSSQIFKMPPKAAHPPLLCKCCDTLPTLAFKPWCWSCTLLTDAECSTFEQVVKPGILTKPKSLCSNVLSTYGENVVQMHTESFSPSPALLTPNPSLQDAVMSRTAESIVAGNPILPMPPLPTHPDSPMSMGGDFLSAPADTHGTDPGLDPSPTRCPPLYDVDMSVFNILNHFRKQWFLSRDHLMKNIVEAQKAPNSHTFIWVEFTPQFHSYLIRSALHLIAESYIPLGS